MRACISAHMCEHLQVHWTLWIVNCNLEQHTQNLLALRKNYISMEPWNLFNTSGKISKSMFTIECNTIKDIHKHTYLQADNSVLILPGTQFKVAQCLNQDNNLYSIILQEIEPSFLLQTVS